MIKRGKRAKAATRTVRLLKAPPRKSTIGDIIKFGARDAAEQAKRDRFRSDIRRFAQEVAPAIAPERARRYLNEAASIAGFGAGDIWYFLHNREREESILALGKLRTLMGDFVAGRRLLDLHPILGHP